METKKQRNKAKDVHYWSKNEIEALVESVHSRVKEDPTTFEVKFGKQILFKSLLMQIFFQHPHAQAFYTNILADNKLLENLNWQKLRDKMSHMKKNFVKAKNWLGSTGAGIEDHESEDTIQGKVVVSIYCVVKLFCP